MQDRHGNSSIQQEEGSFQQQIVFKFEEEISEMPDLELSFVWYWNLDTWESGAEIPGKFWNAVLEKDGEDQLSRSCEKLRNIT